MRKIGIIKYINSLPLHYGLEKYLDIVFDTPRNLAFKIDIGELDLSFIPSVEYLRNKNKYHLVKGVSISSFGETNSVFLFHKGKLSDVKTVKLSHESLTTNFITKEILYSKYNIQPEFVEDVPFELCDASIIIGDNALDYFSNNTSYKFLDIGKVWYDMYKLPMVYAVCVSRNFQKAKEFGKIINHVKKANTKNMASFLNGLDCMVHYNYLSGLNYDLQENHMKTLKIIDSLVKGICVEMC